MQWSERAYIFSKVVTLNIEKPAETSGLIKILLV